MSKNKKNSSKKEAKESKESKENKSETTNESTTETKVDTKIETNVNTKVETTTTKPTKKSDSTHKMDGKYAVLMETNGKEFESWYYFIRVDGNEEALKHLQKHLEEIDWYILEELSTFDLDMTHFVSATTAKEMSKVELNSVSYHRKFDGKLEKIDFGFKRKDNNEIKICKVFDLLGYGQISDFIDDEDIDDEDLISDSESDSEYTDSESSSDYDSADTDSSSEEEKEEKEEKKVEKKETKKESKKEKKEKKVKK